MSELAPVCDDLSAFIIAGRVKGALTEQPRHESDVRTPALGVQDAVDAERLGFRRAWIAERPNLKEAGVVLSAAAARTTRLGVGSGLIAAGSRHPLLMAALGATMHATHGERFTLGLGRGAPGYGFFGSMGFAGFSDYCSILKRLWAGESFDYDGPAGSFGHLKLDDTYPGRAPEIWFGGFLLPRGAEMVARTPAIDGVLLSNMITPSGVRRAIRNLHHACERVGRDPSTVRITIEVVTAPELSEEETRALAHARAVTYFQPTVWANAYLVLNEWEPEVMDRFRAHPQLRSFGDDKPADLAFHRVELLEPAKLIPDEWMEECCALGSIENCVEKLQEFKDAGADEIAVYGSTPAQNAGLLAAWRDHTESRRQLEPAIG